MSRVSVLMSIYEGEEAAYLDECLESLADQTVQADEIVVVKDGPVGEDLNHVLQKWARQLSIREVPLDSNVGLGRALQHGLKATRYEFVARMDADDIARSVRIQRQKSFLQRHDDIDVVGSWIEEFEGAVNKVYARRETPESPESVREYARHRNPLNHMTVMFRKEAVMEVGGYQPAPGLEDYFLWVRMMLNGSRIANISECLVSVRAGDEMVKRRGGWQYFRGEFQFHLYMYRKNFIDLGELVINLATRLVVRLFPLRIRTVTYRVMLRS